MHLTCVRQPSPLSTKCRLWRNSGEELKEFLEKHKDVIVDERYDGKDLMFLDYVFVSTGIKDGDYEKICKVLDLGYCKNLCIDIANGYIPKLLDFVKKIRNQYPRLVIMVGNVCTGDMVQDLILNGADIVKIGIGPGANCTTRKQTGCGRPQLSAVIECAEAAHAVDGMICADGGITCVGDINKAYGAGADFVMVARGGLGHPYLLTQINEYLTNGVLLSSPNKVKQIEYAKEFAYALIKEKGEYIGTRELRGLLPHFFSSFPGYKRVRMQLATSLDSIDSLEKIFRGLEERASLEESLN